MATALIQLATPGDKKCTAWSAMSGSAVTQIVITAGSASAAEARALFDGLRLTVRSTGARSEPAKCGGGFGPGPQGCWAAKHPGPVRRLLVWVADPALTTPPASLTPGLYSAVLPLLPRGTTANLPAGIATAHARWYDPGKIREKVPDVMVSSGLGLDAFRVFISYKHADCAAVAEQLFDALSHEQFEVYLDRFRTLPGTNFLERIRFELADKACVVLLDSENVGASPWVRAEYAFARKYRTGLFAIDLPDGTKTFHRIARRVSLKATGTFTAATTLDEAEIDKAVRFIRNHYATEMARRGRYQRRLIHAAGALAGVSCNPRNDGNIDIGGYYVVAATARPPALDSLRPVCEAAGGSGKAVLVGPLRSPTHLARLDIDWLARETKSALVDERRLHKAMARMASGQL
jgi:hypothetical protein